MFERRTALRHPVRVFLNRYIDGTPHLCEALELSMTGVLVRNVLGPEQQRAMYALEIAAENDNQKPLWLVARPVWNEGAFEALEFFAPSQVDQLRLADLIERAA